MVEWVPKMPEKHLDYFERHSISSLSHCMQLTAPEKGAHVLIVGGTHGNEPGGVAAMTAFHRRVSEGGIELKAGKISMLIGNPEAYARNVRYLERDLNRIFDRREDVTIEGRRAQAILRFFAAQPDIVFVLDLHSVSIGDFRIVVYNAEGPQSEMLARELSPIGIHMAYHPDHLPGTLIEAAGSRGGMIVECGNHRSEAGMETALAHIHLVLTYFGVATGHPLAFEAVPEVVQYETIQPIVPSGNFAFTIEGITTGYFLDAGRRYATDDRGDHLAPEDCYVVVPSQHVRPTDHDAGFLCRRQRI